MNNETQNGYLVLAAISGHTSYLAGAERTHTREMIRTGLPPGTSVTALPRHINGFTWSSATDLIGRAIRNF